MTMKTAMPQEVTWIQEALRSAVESSPVSHSQVERKLGLRSGELASILSGEVELSVAHLFAIPRVIGLDVWKVLIAGLVREESLTRH